MKLNLFNLLTIPLFFIQACNGKQENTSANFKVAPKEFSGKSKVDIEKTKENVGIPAYNNTKGYGEDGKMITEFDCPDSRFFSPIDIKMWDKIQVVNGRFPTYEETMNGTSIHHYGERESKTLKPYNMILPKLASHYNKSTKKEEVVLVIQITQSAEDTIVGYRYLTGGCGGSKFHTFHFLTVEEVKDFVGK